MPPEAPSTPSQHLSPQGPVAQPVEPLVVTWLQETLLLRAHSSLAKGLVPSPKNSRRALGAPAPAAPAPPSPLLLLQLLPLTHTLSNLPGPQFSLFLLFVCVLRQYQACRNVVRTTPSVLCPETPPPPRDFTDCPEHPLSQAWATLHPDAPGPSRLKMGQAALQAALRSRLLLSPQHVQREHHETKKCVHTLCGLAHGVSFFRDW